METTNQAFMAPDEADSDLRRGPWTVEEDMLLANYIAMHGEGRWNSLARSAGLKRTGKSCRLRWLNYLRPDVRRGNLTAEEQLLILELHSRWGNRWSKIAQYLPGRTDNEIKNYWRTRVQKHARQLQCDVNSKQFRDLMRYLWMPRLVEKIQASSAAVGGDHIHQYHPQMPISGVASPENCTSTTNECSSMSATSIPTELCSQAAILPTCTVSTSGIAGKWVAGGEGVETILPPGPVSVTEIVSEPWLNDYGFWQEQGYTDYEGTAAEVAAGSIWNMDGDFWSTQGFQQNYCF